MNILVTGGAGYIGSATTAYLLQAGHQVTVYDNLFRGHKDAIPSDATFIKGDVGDRDALKKVMANGNFDAVIHFAALIEAGESMREPAQYFRTNVVNSSQLLELMMEHEIKKIVFSSTAAVYAGQDTPITEDSPIAPANLYGETKLMMEKIHPVVSPFARAKLCRLAIL